MPFPAETAARLSENCVIINSFSKYFCMTGWRIGWMVAPEPLVRPLDRLQGNLAVSVPTCRRSPRRRRSTAAPRWRR
jgi:aspartate/methionine/tyrosine aminotransferase